MKKAGNEKIKNAIRTRRIAIVAVVFIPVSIALCVFVLSSWIGQALICANGWFIVRMSVASCPRCSKKLFFKKDGGPFSANVFRTKCANCDCLLNNVKDLHA
jgi:hypothetical protein